MTPQRTAVTQPRLHLLLYQHAPLKHFQSTADRGQTRQAISEKKNYVLLLTEGNG